MTHMNIPFSPPDITQEEIDAVSDTLHSGWITTGPKTKQLENELSLFTQTKRTVCLSSATAALELTLRVLGIGAGDEVIVPAYTYTASASVVCHVGANPILVDVPKDAYHIDGSAIEKAITPKTKAIIPVDIGGMMCDYPAILAILESKNALYSPTNDVQAAFSRPVIIADAAHSFGASRGGAPSGSVADFSCFSFHAVKNLTTAEGGSLTWRSGLGLSDEDLYCQFMLYSLHGQTKDALAKNKAGSWEYDILIPGYKCNMTDLLAAIGLVQLHRYPSMLARRKELVSRYNSKFSKFDVDILQHEGSDFSSSSHLYMVRLHGKNSDERNHCISALAEAGIASNVHYKPLPLLTAYQNMGFDINDYPNSYAQFQNEITLPLFSTMTDEQQNYVIEHFSALIR